MNYKAYLRLMRFDKPVGILLLWFPTAWALWLANEGNPPVKITLLFLLGTILMRAAGCVVNDMADRNFDKHVARTKLRPLTSGEVSITESFFILVGLLTAALGVLIQLPFTCFYYAIAALFVTFIYPFCKRFLQAPQLVLGIAFSMGIPMAYVASDKAFDETFIVLMLINFAWIVAYDTMYAMVDKADDLVIGVKSTAIYFADFDRLIIGALLFSMQALWLGWSLLQGVNIWFYLFFLCSSLVVIYQLVQIGKRIPEKCFKAFKVSIYYGWCMWFALLLLPF